MKHSVFTKKKYEVDLKESICCPIGHKPFKAVEYRKYVNEGDYLYEVDYYNYTESTFEEIAKILIENGYVEEGVYSV